MTGEQSELIARKRAALEQFLADLSTYAELDMASRRREHYAVELAEQLMDACAMRNVLTHLYDTIDQERVIRAVDPAISLYQQYDDWVGAQM